MPEPAKGREGVLSAELFDHTRWSLVAAVRDDSHADGRNPLQELSDSYWFPVYACIRNHGHGPAAAYRLAGRFFAALAQQIRQEAPAGFGRFRVFLFERLQRFLDIDVAADATGEAPIAAIEALEQRLASEHVGGARPDFAFERSFGLQVLTRSRARLAEETRRSGRGDMYQQLSPYLSAEPPAASVPLLAANLGIGALAVQVAIKRLRQRFRELVEAEIAETVTNSGELEAERAALLRALSSAS